jgi:hypothetical protein
MGIHKKKTIYIYMCKNKIEKNLFCVYLPFGVQNIYRPDYKEIEPEDSEHTRCTWDRA